MCGVRPAQQLAATSWLRVLCWSRIVCGCLAVWLLAGVAAASEKPNILFIFTDDQCFDTLRAWGNDEIQTPSLDQLANSGTTFTHAYNMGGWNGAICVASRTMLNTGRYLWKARAVDATLPQEVKQGRFWSELMKSAGYRTYMTGKWHVRFPPPQTFDMTRNIRGGMPNQIETGYLRPVEGVPDAWSPFDEELGGFWQGGKHWSEVVADDAIDFLSDAAARENPFFMYLAFNAPHDPRQAPQEFVEMYPQEQIRVPVNFLPQYPYMHEMGAGPGLRDEKLAPHPRTEYAVRVHRQEYYAIITHLDAQIGRILDKLKQTGKDRSTWIFFTADHGLAVGQHGLLGKQNMYDHSIRVPFIVVGPGVPRDQKIDIPIYLQDVMPTTLELAQLEKPAHVDFHSLLPLLSGDQRRSSYEAIYGGYIDSQRMVLQNGYKLILYPQAGKARLYHVDQDPHELQDLFDNPEHLPRSRELFRTLRRLQQQNGDKLDLTTLYPALASG